MEQIFGKFFDTEGFMPHGYCLLWKPEVFWLHVVSDIVIAAAYYSIPFALIYFAMKRPDLAFRWVFFCFGAFIMACGATHIMGLWTLWNPDYAVDGLVKLATAIISITTAVLLWPLMPRALALPSAAQLERANSSLKREIGERENAEAAVRCLNAELELRVAARTAELARTNQRLEAEIAVRRRIEEELRLAKAQAELANRSKTDFLARMSHELRTPLNAIIGFSDILTKEMFGGLGSRKYLEYATDIHGSGMLLLSLINDLLDLAKIEAGKLELVESDVEIGAALDECARLVRDRAATAGLKVDLDVDDDLQPWRIDRRAFKQIVLNLLSNSIKYTLPGGAVTVVAHLDRRGDLRVEVADTGLGIAAADIPRVLEPFTQLDRSRAQEGTGLGLPIVKALVDLHGGRLEIDSTPGEGTTVAILLPGSRMAVRRQAAS